MQSQVAIIGAGPSGLAAALTLSRSMVDNTVLQGSCPARNAASPFVAALPGLDHRPPADVKAAVRKDIENYAQTRFVSEDVEDIEIAQKGFLLHLVSGNTFQADTILLATGMRDILPPLKGLEDLWGSSVINCPFCHGYEWKDRAWGIYAHRPEVIDAAEIYRNWTDDLTYFIDPGLQITEERKHQLAAMGIALEHSLPISLSNENGTLSGAQMAGGGSVPLDCMVIFPHQDQVDLVSKLPLDLTEDGYMAIDEGFRSSIPGIYAAGDLTYAGHQNTPTAFHMGNMAAATIVMDRCFGR